MTASRKRDDSLHALVGSLTQAERRYYVLFVRQTAHEGVAAYEAVFHALLGMEVYEEEALMETVAGMGLRTPFSAFKYQMEGHVLKALRQFHAQRDADRVLLEAMGTLAVLAEKALWRAFDKHLQKAMRLAESCERWHDLLRLLDWQRVAVHHSPSPTHSLLQLQGRSQEVLGRVMAEQQARSLHARMRLLAKQRGTVHGAASEDRPQAVIAELDGLFPEVPGWTIAAICYHNVHGIAALMEGRYAAAFDHLQAASDGWWAHPHLITLEQDLFRVSLTNYFNACLFTGRMDAHGEAETALASLSDLSWSHRLHLDDLRHYNRLRYVLNTGRFAEGRVMMPTIDGWLQENGHRLDPARTVHFLHNIQLFYFFAAEWQVALRYTRRIQHQAHPELRADITNYSDIMELLLLLELEDLEFLGYRLRACQRKIGRKKGFALAEIATRLLTKVLNDRGPAAGHYEEALRRLEGLLAAGKPPFGYWEFRIWVESHVRGRLLTEVFLERVGG